MNKEKNKYEGIELEKKIIGEPILYEADIKEGITILGKEAKLKDVLELKKKGIKELEELKKKISISGDKRSIYLVDLSFMDLKKLYINEKIKASKEIKTLSYKFSYNDLIRLWTINKMLKRAVYESGDIRLMTIVKSVLI